MCSRAGADERIPRKIPRMMPHLRLVASYRLLSVKFHFEENAFNVEGSGRNGVKLRASERQRKCMSPSRKPMEATSKKYI